MYVAVLLKNTLFEQAIFCHSLYMLHELSPKMGATALNNAAVLLRLCGQKVLGIAMWPCGHGIMAMAIGMRMGNGMGVAMYEGKMEGGRLLGQALVWCAYTKGRAFWDSAFCEQPMVAA